MRNIFKFFSRKRDILDQDIANKPRHVAVVMDGNGRWANARGLSRIAGHKKGADSVKALLRSCVKHEIPYLSIFAFSSENWNRPPDEVQALMELLQDALQTQIEKLNENGIRIRFIGNLSQFSGRIQELAAKAEAATAHNTKLVFSVAINYGGRWDIVEACKNIARQIKAGELQTQEINEQLVGARLATDDLPDPDLFIRTSGEQRISNFFLWQSAYTELYFTEVLWPDFDEQQFTLALIDYSQRERRFGGAIDKIKQKAATDDEVASA